MRLEGLPLCVELYLRVPHTIYGICASPLRFGPRPLQLPVTTENTRRAPSHGRVSRSQRAIVYLSNRLGHRQTAKPWGRDQSCSPDGHVRCL